MRIEYEKSKLKTILHLNSINPIAYVYLEAKDYDDACREAKELGLIVRPPTAWSGAFELKGHGLTIEMEFEE